MTRALVVAGTRSGCGKTSVALGLLRAFTRRGLDVQPFKAGPDFIDPGLHARAARRHSHNLDTWMQPEAALRELFARHARGADLVLVEGVMGLFDGRGGADEAGSTAHLAKLLGLPVLLVLDASARARSIAAEAQGYARFDPELSLAGFIANRVGGPRHQAIVREAMGLVPDAPLLGCLPRAEGLSLPSRHLGLVTAGDVDVLESGSSGGLETSLEALADWVEQGLDLRVLYESLPALSLPLPGPQRPPAHGLGAEPGGLPRVGVARDRAFCFVYEENLRLLRAAGAELVFFSPLADVALPEDLDGLILPGGYPELSAAQLAANTPMREAVRAFCASGRPVWAECGGYMYLLGELIDADGARHPMCGALPGRARMLPRRAALGYRTARTLCAGPLGPLGTLLRGHEFHYSVYEPGGAGEAQPAAAFLLERSVSETSGEAASDAAGESGRADGQALGNVVAGYFHAHLSANPEVARAFVEACAAAR